MSHIFSILLLSPLFAGVLILMLPAGRRREIRALAITGALVSTVCAALLQFKFACAEVPARIRLDIPWVPTWGIHLHIVADGYSLPLLLLTSIVALTALLVAGYPDRAKSYYVMLTMVFGASLAAFASANLFFFYFFCEATTVPKYLLTAVWGRLPAGRYTATPKSIALQVTLFIATGAMAVLLAISLLYFLGGHTMDLDALRAYLEAHPLPAHYQRWIFGTMLVGFGIWSTLWPFHVWSPPTYTAMPAPAAMLFAGVVKNFGIYALLRIGIDILPIGARAWAEPLAYMAVINILYGGWVAMRQTDWNRIIAYSSISHAGYLFLALAAVFHGNSALALNTVIFFMVAHGVVSALFFLLTERLQADAGSRFIGDLGGLGKTMPFLGVTVAVAVIAGCGLPGFANFVGEVMVFIAAWSEGTTAFRVGAIAAVWGVVMTATYLFRALRATFHGELRPECPMAPRTSLSVRFAVILLILFSALLGVWPRTITNVTDRLTTSAAIVAGGTQ